MPLSIPKPPAVAGVDAVVIGRNEGARLIACLTALRGQAGRIIYVDSGSTDGSAVAAEALGAEVVALDMARPFTAARARNAGLMALALGGDATEFVQMMDGDCALREGWLGAALAHLVAHPQAALVFGRRRERFPEASVYNQLCDREWDVPLGEVRACGGDMLVRRAALAAVGGYRDDVIAAEDDELAQRLRAEGWTLWRIEAEMTWHDAAILRFGQWWRRAVRAGHGFAQVGSLHPGHFVPERRRVWFWGAALPLVFGLGLVLWPGAAVAVLGLYGLSGARTAWRFWRGGMGLGRSMGCAGLITLSKLPNMQGMLTWFWRNHRGAGPRIIEYK